MKSMGEPRIRVIAMPKDTNPAGNIFGGWLLSHIDLAGALAAREVAPERTVTISMKEVLFKEPVFVGDAVSFYSRITHVGTTSITVIVKVVVQRFDHNAKGLICVPVTEAEVTYVSMEAAGNKKPIDPELKKIHGF